MFFIFILQKFCLFVLIIRSIYICSTKFQIKKMIRNFLKSLNLLISLTDLKLLFIKPNTGIPSIFLAFHFNIKLYNHNIHIFFLTCRSLSHKNFFTCNIKPHTYWKFSVLAIPLAKHGLCVIKYLRSVATSGFTHAFSALHAVLDLLTLVSIDKNEPM